MWLEIQSLFFGKMNCISQFQPFSFIFKSSNINRWAKLIVVRITYFFSLTSIMINLIWDTFCYLVPGNSQMLLISLYCICKVCIFIPCVIQIQLLHMYIQHLKKQVVNECYTHNFHSWYIHNHLLNYFRRVDLCFTACPDEGDLRMPWLHWGSSHTAGRR